MSLVFFRPIITEHLWILLKLRLSIMHSAMHTWQNYKSNWPGTVSLISPFNILTWVKRVYHFLPMELSRALGFGRYCKLLVAWHTLTTTSWHDKFPEHLLEMMDPCVYVGLLSAVQVSFQRSSFFSTSTLVIGKRGQNIGTIWLSPDSRN